jgi:hypothetical protein
VLHVDREEPADPCWFVRLGADVVRLGADDRVIPRDFDLRAVFHYVSGNDDNDPEGLIECSDGAVFTSEDAS